MSRLSIEISPEQHQKIKAMAVIQGKSIKDLVLDKVFKSGTEEDDAWEQLMQIIDTRIEEVEISDRKPDQIMEDVLHRKKAI